MNPLSRGHLEVAVPVSSDRGTLVSKALRDGLHDTSAPGLRSRARRCALGPQCDASLAVKGAVPNGRRPLRFKPAAPLTDLTTQLTGQGGQGVGISVHRRRVHRWFRCALLWTVLGARRTSSTSSSLSVPLPLLSAAVKYSSAFCLKSSSSLSTAPSLRVLSIQRAGKLARSWRAERGTGM